jgi:hypothetical protein
MKFYWIVSSLLVALTFSAHGAGAKEKPIVKKSACVGAGQSLKGNSMGKIEAPGNVCCDKLQEGMPKDLCNAPIGGYAGICLPCGDGVCDANLENNCNCPADCK